ncbi:ABC transporter ATP-binding protein [Saccharomonospora xinjiangensis]|uniref:ATPase component of various ABC-type transport systems with duplicated ATPase domain n=1 Tax=Saccharomonospora xinjiangensis XJ-54 TaxID=882086 RepID=I0V548_9PSEU|nr:ABC transporter ATP-binding protein [Saccharomonospora xinjiangensis]EID55251.1 ATPase component of various ABC-type transport systems with duplicated ATPase domain [Saccharomonospora xinjiangensis XJ-54]
MSVEAVSPQSAESSQSVLSISDLKISFSTEDGVVEAVKGIGFDVAPGEILAIVGESGSGKSVTSMSVPGLLPKSAKIAGARKLGDVDLGGMSPKQLRKHRGSDVAMIFQEPMTALNPMYTVGWQIREALRAHQDISKQAADKRAIELLDMVGIPEPARRFKQYPHQLSGGLRQRVVIAMAIACDPKVIIADEPTTALDVTVQAEILALLRKLRDTLNTAIVLITHDMGVVADLADRVVVMYQGEIVEQAPVRELFANPQQDYTKRLLAAVPVLGQRPEGQRLLDTPKANVTESKTDAALRKAHEKLQSRLDDSAPALAIKDLVLEYPGKGRQGKNRAVDNVSLHIDRGEILGLVGESGSGKSTVGRCAIRLLKPTSGTVTIAGTDITTMSHKDLRPMRMYFSIVFQDPASTLDPKMTIGDSIAEPLVLHKILTGKDLDNRVADLLDKVQLSGHYRNRYPHELSGGQRQRVAIARALALDPKLLIADEPTSALDVSVQAKVLDLFLDLQQHLRFACLFISHDLAVVDLLADRVAVMQHGKLVEVGTREQVLHDPQQEYTKRLLSAAPVADPELQAERRRAWEEGRVAPVKD